MEKYQAKGDEHHIRFKLNLNLNSKLHISHPRSWTYSRVFSTLAKNTNNVHKTEVAVHLMREWKPVLFFMIDLFDLTSSIPKLVINPPLVILVVHLTVHCKN